MKALRVRWIAAMARLDAGTRRDRRMLLAALVGVCVVAEALVVQPLAQRRTVLQSGAADEAAAASDAIGVAREQVQARRAEIERDIAALEARLGAGAATVATSQPFGALLRRALPERGVRLGAMRLLPSEQVGPAAATETGDAPHAAEPAMEPAAAPLYRHRLELVLHGRYDAVQAALAWLDREMTPLRIERLTLATPAHAESDAENAAPRSDELRATLILTLLGTERTWLAL